MKLTRYSQYEMPQMSKEEAFRALKEEHITFDYTLPQDMLDNLTKFEYSRYLGLSYDLIRSTTVWAYGEHDYFGHPISCCIEVQSAWDKYLAR